MRRFLCLHGFRQTAGGGFWESIGALVPKTQAVFQHFVRVVETTLGDSFNTQSQVPDIPGISSHNAFDVYFGSLDAQSKAPDIPSPSLCASIQEPSVSFNL